MTLLSRLMRYVPDPSPVSRRSQMIAETSHAREDVGYVDARPSNELQIHLGEHWGIVGSTGTGKTVFTARGLFAYLARMYPEVPRYMLDSTDDPDMDNLLPNNIHVYGDEPPDLLHDSKRTLVWTPTHSKIPKQYATWFNRLNDSRQPTIVGIDEVASITREALQELEVLFKQMRKHGGTVAAETQRIAKVDSDVFSQLTHFVLFNINPEPYDVLQARTYLNVAKEDFRMPQARYGFHYRRTRGQHAAKEFHSMDEFFGDTIY